MTKPIIPTRKELERFLPDQRSIKAFEGLFRSINPVIEDSGAVFAKSDKILFGEIVLGDNQVFFFRDVVEFDGNVNVVLGNNSEVLML